ncbi:3-O-methyltransferase 2 [Favolaschia claudopus]|uniref:3-O-methyltransferase 2 n=1 Tax=Favolaschia claudopus TaxID=2862362 RepID=A0AAW0D6W5_9AGAR
MITPATDPVSSLLKLIKDAARTLQAGYIEADGHLPSLDETEPHPLDRKLSTPEMQEAAQTLEGACAQLCATLTRPNHTVLNNLFMTGLEPNCARVALTFKIPDILQETPSGMHVTELSKRCGGVEPSKLARILRLLSAKHCFREVKRDVFANNRLSVQLLAANPLHSMGLHITEDTTEGASKLAETLADPEWGSSFEIGHSAWNKATGQPLPMFDYWAKTPGMEKYGERFGIGMLGWGTAVEATAVVSAYPWANLKADATVCDFGGGVGAMAIQLARAYPQLHLKLQDLPDRMVQAETVLWPAECPEAIEENRIEFKAFDFFVESPIPGCDVYYLKNILHAFSTQNCITILKGIRKVMKPDSRVLLHEYILQTAPDSSIDSESDLEKNAKADMQLKHAPWPLLGNYGQGRIRQYYLDVSLMVLMNSQERTLAEYSKLAEEAGLQFIKVWDFGDMGGVELCVRDAAI